MPDGCGSRGGAIDCKIGEAVAPMESSEGVAIVVGVVGVEVGVRSAEEEEAYRVGGPDAEQEVFTLVVVEEQEEDGVNSYDAA